MIQKAKFGPAGNAQSFAAAGYKSTVDAPKWLHEMGLNAFEYQCGHGVQIGDETAGKIGEQAAIYGVTLSLHTPYYINLSSDDSERMEKNAGYILQSCRAAQAMGAKRMVVHGGGQGKLSRERALKNTVANIQNILREMDAAGYSQQVLCMETMGKQSVIGSAQEIFDLVATDDRLLPCIDFGHLNARTQGKYRSKEAFSALFDLMENTIGIERARIFHSHFSKIEYGDKGEKRHLTFEDTIYGPEFDPVAELVAARGYTPTFICESAGVQAEDAVTMKSIYERACGI